LINADLSRERMKASGQEDYYERRLGFLPEDRRTRVRELLEQFDDAEQKIRDKETADNGALSAGDRAQLRLLRLQREAELDQMLALPEKQQYELWLSPTRTKRATRCTEWTRRSRSFWRSIRRAKRLRTPGASAIRICSIPPAASGWNRPSPTWRRKSVATLAKIAMRITSAAAMMISIC